MCPTQMRTFSKSSHSRIIRIDSFDTSVPVEEKETLVLDQAESEAKRSDWEHWWVFELLTAVCK